MRDDSFAAARARAETLNAAAAAARLAKSEEIAESTLIDVALCAAVAYPDMLA